MRKFICVLLSAFLGFAVIFAAGCSSDIDDLEDLNADDINYSQYDESTEATLKISITAYDTEEALINSVAEVFNEKYPNVTINIDRMSGTLTNTLVSYYNAEKANPGTMPDIWISTSFDMLALSEYDITLDLDEYLKAASNQTSPYTGEAYFDEEDYVEEYWVLGKNNFADEQLLIPRSADRVVMHTNVDIISKAQTWVTSQGYTDADFLAGSVGQSQWITDDYITDTSAAVDIESKLQNGWTWEDFLYLLYWCRQYYDSLGRTADAGDYLIDGYLSWEANYNPIFTAMGVDYWDENGDFNTDTENWEEALDMIKFLIDEGFSAPFTGGSAGFTSGEGVFLIHSQASSISIESLSKTNAYQNVTDMSEVYNVYTFPLIDYYDNPQIGSGVAGYSVYKNSSNRELAVLFLLDLISAEGQTAMANAGINYPSIRVDMQDTDAPWAANYSEYNMEAYIWGLEYTCATDYFLEKPAKYASSIMSSVTTLIQNYCGGKSISTVLSDCAGDIEYYLEWT